jgi:mRNA-degrading endonuclease RelE of RelBE toxin-antitoxin system
VARAFRTTRSGASWTRQVSEESAPQRIAVVWSPEARAELRAIERETARQILSCLDRYPASRVGDVKRLNPPFTGFRLRCGDYRVFFEVRNANAIDVTSVRNRREAYR